MNGQWVYAEQHQQLFLPFLSIEKCFTFQQKVKPVRAKDFCLNESWSFAHDAQGGEAARWFPANASSPANLHTQLYLSAFGSQQGFDFL